MERNYDKHVELLNTPSNCQGCIRNPAMAFNAEHSPPDMLHLKKGIISKLVNQLVEWMILQGKEHQLLGQMKKHKIPFV